MEDLSEAEKLLSDNLNKCRCCFRMLIDDRRAVKISQEIRMHFSQLTNIEVDKDLYENILNLIEIILATCIGDLC